MNDKIKTMIANLRKDEQEFWNKYQTRVDELLNICKTKQGEYLPGHHGSGSWATTYSNEFIFASSELLTILKSNRNNHPIALLGKLFRESNIKSCRGAEMTYERVEYLYNTHLKQRIEITR